VTEGGKYNILEIRETGYSPIDREKGIAAIILKKLEE
jgi:hypothetical protein